MKEETNNLMQRQSSHLHQATSVNLILIIFWHDLWGNVIIEHLIRLQMDIIYKNNNFTYNI